MATDSDSDVPEGLRRERDGPRFWRRLGANGIDFALATVFMAAALVAEASATESNHAIAVEIAVIGLAIAYFAAMERSRLGASLGKLAFGLKVVDASGRRPGLAAALLRNAVKVVAVTLFVFGTAIWALAGLAFWDRDTPPPNTYFLALAVPVAIACVLQACGNILGRISGTRVLRRRAP